jgi:hypothetical protein
MLAWPLAASFVSKSVSGSTNHAACIGRFGSPARQLPPLGSVWADDNEELLPSLQAEPYKTPVDPEQLDVVNNMDEVATVVRNRLEAAAVEAIADRGHFALCASWSQTRMQALPTHQPPFFSHQRLTG